MSLGLVAAVVFVLGSVVIWLLPTAKQWWAAAILLIIVTPLALSGFWFSLPQWGISDWDYYFSLHHTYREIILKYHQFPFWNPVTCGGTAGLAEPEFPVLTPTFLLELLFDIPMGVRLAIFLSVATTALGTLVLGKKIGLSPIAALTTAAILSFGSVNLLEIVEGHVNILAVMWIPWILWAWLRTYRREIRPIWCGIFLALTFFGGGIYLLMYTALAFLTLPLLTKNIKRGYLTSLNCGLWGLGFAAVKLIPVFLWLRQFQDKAYAGATYTLPYIHQILFGRYLHGSEVLPNQGTGWHEYGAYIGLAAGLLALLGSVATWRSSRVTRGLVIAGILALLLSSSGPLLKPAFDHMSWFPRSSISRLILFTVIPISLLAGIGIDWLRKQFNYGYIAAFILLVVSATELLTFAHQLSQQAFVLPPVVPFVTPAPPPLAFTAFTYTYRTPAGVDYDRTYAAVLAGYGSLNYCSSVGPDPRVRTIHDEEDNGIISVDNHTGTVKTLEWTPNHVHLSGEITKATTVILNTNYADGWAASGQPVHNRDGRVATKVSSPGQFDITFAYHTPGFIPGLFLSLLTILSAFLYSKMRQLWT